MTEELEPSPEVKQFIVNVRYIWRWASMWVLSVAALAPMALELVPSLHGFLSQSTEHYLSSALAILAMIARVLPQPAKESS